MECLKVEELISEYIENELPKDVHDEISAHLEGCADCRALKEKVEELIYACPELEEEVPFFLKNRLYYIAEAREDDNIIQMDDSRVYLRWIAAAIGGFVLFLNLFYFTNIYPPAQRTLHSMVSGIETLAVKAEGLFQRVKGTQDAIFPESDEQAEPDLDKFAPDDKLAGEPDDIDKDAEVFEDSKKTAEEIKKEKEEKEKKKDKKDKKKQQVPTHGK